MQLDRAEYGQNLPGATGSAASPLESYVSNSMAHAANSMVASTRRCFTWTQRRRALRRWKDKFSQIQAPVYHQVGT